MYYQNPPDHLRVPHWTDSDKFGNRVAFMQKDRGSAATGFGGSRRAVNPTYAAGFGPCMPAKHQQEKAYARARADQYFQAMGHMPTGTVEQSIITSTFMAIYPLVSVPLAKYGTCYQAWRRIRLYFRARMKELGAAPAPGIPTPTPSVPSPAPVPPIPAPVPPAPAPGSRRTPGRTMAMRRAANPMERVREAVALGGIFCGAGYYWGKDAKGNWKCIKGSRAWKFWETRPSPLYPESQARPAFALKLNPEQMSGWKLFKTAMQGK